MPRCLSCCSGSKSSKTSSKYITKPFYPQEIETALEKVRKIQVKNGPKFKKNISERQFSDVITSLQTAIATTTNLNRVTRLKNLLNTVIRENNTHLSYTKFIGNKTPSIQKKYPTLYRGKTFAFLGDTKGDIPEARRSSLLSVSETPLQTQPTKHSHNDMKAHPKNSLSIERKLSIASSTVTKRSSSSDTRSSLSSSSSDSQELRLLNMPSPPKFKPPTIAPPLDKKEDPPLRPPSINFTSQPTPLTPLPLMTLPPSLTPLFTNRLFSRHMSIPFLPLKPQNLSWLRHSVPTEVENDNRFGCTEPIPHIEDTLKLSQLIRATSPPLDQQKTISPTGITFDELDSQPNQLNCRV